MEPSIYFKTFFQYTYLLLNFVNKDIWQGEHCQYHCVFKKKEKEEGRKSFRNEGKASLTKVTFSHVCAHTVRGTQGSGQTPACRMCLETPAVREEKQRSYRGEMGWIKPFPQGFQMCLSRENNEAKLQISSGLFVFFNQYSAFQPPECCFRWLPVSMVTVLHSLSAAGAHSVCDGGKLQCSFVVVLVKEFLFMFSFI